MNFNHGLIIIILFVSNSLLYSQKYEKDISTTEKRINEFKKSGEYPEDWKLFYRGKESDFVVFYDLDGTEIYFKYRRDHLDRESEKKTVGLFQGQAYRIKGKFMGILQYFDEAEKKKFLPPVFILNQEISAENKKSVLNKLIYTLISFESTALDEVIK